MILSILGSMEWRGTQPERIDREISKECKSESGKKGNNNIAEL